MTDRLIYSTGDRSIRYTDEGGRPRLLICYGDDTRAVVPLARGRDLLEIAHSFEAVGLDVVYGRGER